MISCRRFELNISFESWIRPGHFDGLSFQLAKIEVALVLGCWDIRAWEVSRDTVSVHENGSASSLQAD
jgi:hypothetical protein